MATEPSEIPRGMQKVYERFARWRSDHPGVRLPIPPRLWKAAAKVAREQGVCRTAQVLRLDYSKLKQMAGANGASVTLDARKGRRVRHSLALHNTVTGLPAAKLDRARSTVSVPSFLEVVGASAIAGSECVIELEGAQGKMRIQWKGIGAPDLAALGRVVLEPRGK